MTLLSFVGMPPWATLPGLAIYAAGGVGLGTLYFYALWWNTHLYINGRGLMLGLLLATSRHLGLAGALTLASLAGAKPLLALTCGVLIARFVVIYRTSEGPP